MKLKTVANLLILTSVVFFTACSNKTPKVDKNKLSKSEIRAKRVAYLKSLPLAKTYPVVEKKYSTPVVDHYQGYTNSIEVVSHNSYQPTIQKTYIANSNIIKNKIERDAKSFLGTRYVWGATGPNKFDCSGFTQWVYRDAGIKIPRVSRHQAEVGEYVSYENLKKGDMVFFDTKKRRTGRVCHVGIYLGNNNFIHASSGAKKVVIYNFNRKPFYKKRFLWGRRVIKSTNHFAMR
jgi:cell wall-associated NlpC family hydrolase